LRRVVQRQVEHPIARRLLAGAFTEGDTVVVDHTPDGYVFSRQQAVAA
jgi:ATP-dependent Clp protease ATP-binding subunit ClpA